MLAWSQSAKSPARFQTSTLEKRLRQRLARAHNADGGTRQDVRMHERDACACALVGMINNGCAGAVHACIHRSMYTCPARLTGASLQFNIPCMRACMCTCIMC